jgi:hypothetical protein
MCFRPPYRGATDCDCEVVVSKTPVSKQVPAQEALTPDGKLRPGYSVHQYYDESGRKVTEYYYYKPRVIREAKRKRA